MQTNDFLIGIRPAKPLKDKWPDMDDFQSWSSFSQQTKIQLSFSQYSIYSIFFSCPLFMVLVHFQEGKKTGAAATKQQEHSSHIWHESGNILEVIELQTGKPKNSFKIHNGDINETTGC